MASTARVRLISGSASSTRAVASRAGSHLSLTPLGTETRFASTLEAARTGDQAAISALYRVVQPRVLRFLRFVRPSAADQLAWATWLDTVAEMSRFHGDEAALVARALSLAYRRAHDGRGRPARRERHERSQAHVPLDGLADLSGLPRASAEVLLLRVLGGMSVDEVAEVTSRRRGTVRLLQRLALRRVARNAVRRGGSR